MQTYAPPKAKIYPIVCYCTSSEKRDADNAKHIWDKGKIIIGESYEMEKSECYGCNINQ